MVFPGVNDDDREAKRPNVRCVLMNRLECFEKDLLGKFLAAT